MEWKQRSDGSWEAKGSEGTFIVWKFRHRVYKARYTSAKKQFYLPSQTTEKKMKVICEDNYYWEDKKQ